MKIENSRRVVKSRPVCLGPLYSLLRSALSNCVRQYDEFYVIFRLGLDQTAWT